ncbi:MAG: hypothetical protein AB8F78_15990 [Saprospiraceae bacterium]
MLINVLRLIGAALLIALSNGAGATVLSQPFDVTSMTTSDVSSCSDDDGEVFITLDASNPGVGPYDISVDNGAT